MKAYGASHRGGPTEDVIIDRSRYLAHPRVKMDGRPADRFAAEREIDDLHRLFPNATVVRLHEMTFGEQVRLMARTRRLRGMHGAGLTHLLFLPPGAEAVEWYGEITGGMYVFELLATWRPDVRYGKAPKPGLDVVYEGRKSYGFDTAWFLKTMALFISIFGFLSTFCEDEGGNHNRGTDRGL